AMSFQPIENRQPPAIAAEQVADGADAAEPVPSYGGAQQVAQPQIDLALRHRVVVPRVVTRKVGRWVQELEAATRRALHIGECVARPKHHLGGLELPIRGGVVADAAFSL